MWPLSLQICALMVSTFGLSSVTAVTCEETETSLVKLDLAKHSISVAKSLYPKCQDEASHSNCSLKDKSLAHLNAAMDLISEASMMCFSCPNSKVIVLHDTPMDCSDVRRNGFNESGVYQVWPRGRGVISNESINVYCDMKTDGGGWTVIQRRGRYAELTDFYLDWESYKNGFGDIQQEFWLGNENIYFLTKQGNYSVRFDLVDVRREYRFAIYDTFSIGDENSSYVLHIGRFKGNATNDMTSHYGQKFSTKDRQNDGRGELSACSSMYKSAFWFSNGCGNVNLNGVYQPGVESEKGIWWFGWKGNYECLYTTEIKIRRKKAWAN